MDAREFAEWVAMERIDPLPQEWPMWADAMALQANIWRGKGRTIKRDDFMPVKPPRKILTRDEMAAKFAQFFAERERYSGGNRRPG